MQSGCGLSNESDYSGMSFTRLGENKSNYDFYTIFSQIKSKNCGIIIESVRSGFIKHAHVRSIKHAHVRSIKHAHVDKRTGVKAPRKHKFL